MRFKNFAKNIYDFSPFFIQNVILSNEGKKLLSQRFDENYQRIVNLWEKTQWYSRGELEDYQNEKLRMLINHIYENVTYYQKIMRGTKLVPSDIKNIKDLHKLPILTKKDVKENYKELISKSSGRLWEGHSSGTTGSPVDVLWDSNTIAVHNAAIWRHRQWTGFEFGRPYATLLGRVIVPINQKKPPFWRYNKPWNQLFLSSFHLDEKNLPFYFEAMKQYGIEAMQAYPSTIYILARYLQQAGEYFPLKYIFTSSETLLTMQRDVIEERFCCKVFDCYGLAERVMYSGECSMHMGHHLYMEYGIAEIVNERNENLDDGKYGRIIATGFNNFGMPLVRYEVGDVTTYKVNQCPCGRGLPLLEAVTTKAEDIVITPDGRFISPSVLTHPFKPMHNIEKSQLIQESHDHLLIKVVKRDGYTEKDTEVLLREMHKRVGEKMRVTIEYVEDIERSQNGKYRWVISRLPLKYKQQVFNNLYE